MNEQSVKVLCIDDDVEVGTAWAEVLESEGYAVTYISSPQQAVEVLEKEQFHIILSDYNMPGLNGEQVAQRIRAKGDLTPVIFLTAFVSKEFAIAALRLGASDVLEKPCRHQVLVSSIQRVLEIERRRAEVYSAIFADPSNPDIQKKLKMLGLMQVANHRKAA